MLEIVSVYVWTLTQIAFLGFFNAFGPLIQPNVCILLDVGTKPTGTSLYELWKCFDKHKNVGGACGEYVYT